MTLLNRFFVSYLFIGLIFLHVPITSADESVQQYQSLPPTLPTPPPQKTYSATVKNKALHGLANISTGWLEIPKSIINTTNAPGNNFVFGLVGGGFKGVLETLARTGSGFVDLVTSPMPTRLIQSQYIWQDFDKESTYGPVFVPNKSRTLNPQDVPASH